MAKTSKLHRMKVITIIKTLWDENPNLRFGQLIENVIESGRLYYKEDKDLIRELKEYYDESV